MSNSKSPDNLQWGVVSLDGLAHAPYPVDVVNGRGRGPMVDAAGRVAVRIADAGGYVDGAFSSRVEVNTGPGLVRDFLMSAVPCRLQHFSAARDSGTGNRFVQLYDVSAGPVPVATRPDVVVGWDGGDPGVNSSELPMWTFQNGLLIAISITADFYTDPGADQWLWQTILFV